jgi:hypothetical protein
VPPRQNEGAATDDDLRLTPARSDEGSVSGGANKVEASKHPPDKVTDCRNGDDYQQRRNETTHASHLLLRSFASLKEKRRAREQWQIPPLLLPLPANIPTLQLLGEVKEP